MANKISECGFPPVIPNFEDTLSKYTGNIENLPSYALTQNLQTIPVEKDATELIQLHPIEVAVSMKVNRCLTTGKLLSFEEIEGECVGETARNSLSLARALGSSHDVLKGSSANYPFWPGGFEDPSSGSTNETLEASETKPMPSDALQNFDNLLWTFPSGENGIQYNSDTDFKVDELSNELDSINFWTEKVASKERQSSKTSKENMHRAWLNELPDEISLPKQSHSKHTMPVLKISKTPYSSHSTMFLPWAQMIDVSKPMDDFHEKVPSMAFEYPFELDTFQKQAVAKLENHQNVFVAAHTSAGKTVVAEYAIALSVKHMTRAIYTSPIKALSNQKFRDFRNSFESVGLVTGDVQINANASCLIMTTEILRSMLYNGSDVIRDLEWVIFDEIHYLNNEERGHVWEEVLIMLPEHVSIIMLSATVPNAIQFANWVGEIKKKIIYVITTQKRPVPLEHYLYTGSGGNSRSEMFLILDSKEQYKKKGYDDAVNAKKARMSKHQQSFGPKQGNQGFNENAEKTTYIGLINHLKETDNLPVVVFTFSRNRCDTYARLISSATDLCTGAQKGEIKGFFLRSINHLKGTDRDLPQVKLIQEMLLNGVGVHHSGILPILKEVVEMLFQKGLVKLLFATETFAMGVNMPARCVVFDSMRKHDGTCFRMLNPAEYIQMAGRSGRRGLDTTGTVIMLCKQSIPDELDLKNMLLGKAAKLESQFRLTYSMILNLLRVESLSVEDVMKRSFLEAGSQQMKADDIKKRIDVVRTKAEEIKLESRESFELLKFYEETRDFLKYRDSLFEHVISHPKVRDVLSAGRVVIVESLPTYTARYGIIMNRFPVKEGNQMNSMYQVLILTSPLDHVNLEEKGLNVSKMDGAELLLSGSAPHALEMMFMQFLYYSSKYYVNFQPTINQLGYPDHKIISVSRFQILEISEVTIRIDIAAVLNDVKKREAPRFQDELPLLNVRKVLEQLYLISDGSLQAPLMYPLNMLAFKDSHIALELKEMYRIKYELKAQDICSRVTNFTMQFKNIFLYMRLLDECAHMEYLLSPKSLRLHEEYEIRINVLRQLGYIDNENMVELKGRVACEMGNQNELMVTEMVLNNMLSQCTPAEVAAVLSCMVVEAKNIEEPNLDEIPSLKEKVEAVKSLALTIAQCQQKCGLREPVDQFVEQFKFGLVEVVYEWARGKSFCEIMRLTEVQEGLIVRTIQRLDEMIRDVKDAARIIGDPTLKKKMEETSACIKRDIVFAASLYTQ